jgi:general secretion pathway protein A
MYEEYFGLNERPYSTSPDPRFFYLSPQHKEALAKAAYAINERMGLSVIYGNVGTGKTTVARRIYQQFQDSQDHQVVMLIHPDYPTPNQLLRAIVQEFKIGKTAQAKLDLLNLFKDYLFERAVNKKETQVLLIDESQTMKPPLLELLRQLLNIETNNQKLLQIVLFGQDELGRRLDLKPNLKSRVALYGVLSPLGLEDTNLMLTFRYQIAGGKELPFSKEAIELIFKYSKGLPREVVKLADNTLIKAMARNKKVIDKSLVDESAKELRLGEEFEIKPKSKGGKK